MPVSVYRRKTANNDFAQPRGQKLEFWSAQTRAYSVMCARDMVLSIDSLRGFTHMRTEWIQNVLLNWVDPWDSTASRVSGVIRVQSITGIEKIIVAGLYRQTSSGLCSSYDTQTSFKNAAGNQNMV